MSRVLVTGASGFIGAVLAKRLSADGHDVRGTRFRRAAPAGLEHIAWCTVGSIGRETDWSEALRETRVVVHTAALAHRAGCADEADEVNTQGTLQLARSAAAAGVDRFVFLSSIGVHGSSTVDAPFTEASPLCPQDHYARSKERAEVGLREISGRTGLRTTIIRSPLVYGPGAPGNFARLVRLVRTRMPLPLGGIRNRRSLIAVENLVDVLAVCAFDRAADDEEFVVCDGEDLSTPQLLRLIAEGLGVPLRLIPAPASLLRLAAQALGRRQEMEKLIQSLTIDASKLRERMHWRPRVSAAAAVVTAAREWPQDHRA